MCARVFLAMSDTIMGLHDSDDITIAPLIKQLYLTKQLHELYFAGYTYTVYDYCKRFFLVCRFGMCLQISFVKRRMKLCSSVIKLDYVKKMQRK